MMNWTKRMLLTGATVMVMMSAAAAAPAMAANTGNANAVGNVADTD